MKPGIALVRLSAFGAVAVAVGLVLATFGTGASQSNEEAGLATLQVAVYFFGPIAAILALAFIVVLALTRPASMALAGRRRAARVVALGYGLAGALMVVAVRSLPWASLICLGVAITALGAWWLMRRDDQTGLGTPMSSS